MTEFAFLDPEVKVRPELVFIGPGEEGIKAVTASGTFKVKVREPFRIVHEGQPYTGGDVIEVPDNDTTRFWLTARWVEKAPVSQKGKA